jgi:hypothetical protein
MSIVTPVCLTISLNTSVFSNSGPGAFNCTFNVIGDFSSGVGSTLADGELLSDGAGLEEDAEGLLFSPFEFPEQAASKTSENTRTTAKATLNDLILFMLYPPNMSSFILFASPEEA